MKTTKRLPLLKALLLPACALAVPASLWAQAAPAPSAAATSTTPAEGVAKPIELSPFTVETSRDRGYAAENTLAGSRLNSKLEDLAASITVVTKQQLEDTAALDINDVFKYEVGTEGSSTYTPQVLDRGTFKDTISGYSFGNTGATTTNAQSNRVRGMGAPDAMINYFPTNNRIPFDTYNTQSVEINRGPNSMLFGMGSPAGVVNQSTAQAVLNRNSNSVQLRTDHLGSERASFSFNRSIIDDKLALYGAFLYNNNQFERKPSFERMRRQFGAVTVRPFQKTVIRASVENVDIHANRPNFVTPRDYASDWFRAGRPAYDPVDGTVTILDSGQVLGPYYFSTRSPRFPTRAAGAANLTGAALMTTSTSPYYIPFGIGFDAGGSAFERFDNGRQIDYFLRAQGTYATAHTNPATATVNTGTAWAVNDPRYLILDRNWTMSMADFRQRTTVIDGTTYRVGSYNLPGVNDKSLYDWTKYNVNEPNFGITKARNYYVDMEQQITEKLFFSAGWLRQEIKGQENYILSQLQGNTLQIDTNTRKPDGTPNAYFGLPFVQLGSGNGVDTFFTPQTDDNMRAMLAYDFDYFSRQNNILRHLGRHRLLGLWSEQESTRTVERWRLGYRQEDSDPDFRLQFTRNLALSGQAFWNGTNIKKAYYLASPGDPQGRVAQSAGYYGNPGWDGAYHPTIQAYKFNATLADPNITAGDGWRTMRGTEQISFSDAGSFRAYRNVESLNFGTQSYLWRDRIIATLGWRRDDFRARQTTGGAIRNPDGSTTPAVSFPNQGFANGWSGDINYDLFMNRWGAYEELSGDTKTLGVAFRPFKDWRFTDRPGAVMEFVRSATLYYNKSDNFNPPSSAQTDYFRNPLPKPTGNTEELGFGFNMFDNKLVARINWFETNNNDERTGAAGTLLTRLIYSDTTTGIPWASAVVRIRNAMAAGQTIQQIISTPNWNTDQVNNISDDANQEKVWALLKLPRNYYAGISQGATQQSQAKGTEVQLTYNPTRNWTMKLTATKTETTYTDVAPQYDAWLAERMPVWQSMEATDIPDFTETFDSGGTRQWSLRKFWTGYGFSEQARLENQSGITTPQQYHQNVVESQVALAKALQGVVAPNQRKYNVRYLTNYAFASDAFNGRLRGVSLGGSARWESKGAAGYLGKVGDPNVPDLLNVSDITKPVYFDNGRFYTDVWVSYSRKLFSDRINMKLQLNVENVFEDGRLEPVAVNFDGQPWAYRIIDPRKFILTATFGF